MELVIKGNNLYRNGSIVEFNDGSDELLLTREPMEITGDITDVWHTVCVEDRLDLLAYRYYSNVVDDASKYWWVLADANGITNPMDISSLVGTRILVPNILTILLNLQ